MPTPYTDTATSFRLSRDAPAGLQEAGPGSSLSPGSDPSGRGTVSPEQRLLLLCARTRLTASQREGLEHLLRRPPDWARVRRLAAHHNVQPLLYRHLRAVEAARPGTVPGDVVEDLASSAHQTSAYNAFLVQELVRLMEQLRQRGVPAMPFKGPVLAQHVYGDVSLRRMSDLDILIPPGRFGDVERVLLENGYAPGYSFGGIRRALFMRLEGEYPFVRGAATFVVDLHTRLAPPRFSYDVAFDELWSRAAVVEMGRRALRTLAAEDLLQMLCYHGSKNEWRRLKGCCDVAETVAAFPALDWDAVLGRARRLRGEGILLLGLGLARAVLGTELPADVVRRTAHNPGTMRHVAAATATLLGDPSLASGYVSRHRFQLSMRGTVAAKVRYALSTLTMNKLTRRLVGI